MAEYNYAALASTIKIEDITSDEHNQTILQRLKDNDTSLDKLLICEDVGMIFGEGTTIDYYAPDFDNVEELGWLGYYIGQNTNLNKLYFYENRHTNMYDSERPFFQGLNCNKSIQEIHFDGFDMSEGRLFSMMGPFFKSNDSLSKVEIENCEFGVEGASQLSLAIGDCSKSLNKLSMDNIDNEMENGQLVDIITALSMHPQLTVLRFECMSIGRNECTALSTLLRCTTTNLQKLNLSDNNIDDEGIEVLVQALSKNNQLQDLDLGSNRSITIRGWTALSTLLEMPSSNLKSLDVSPNNIGDEGELVFVNALSNNSTLETLGLYGNGISAEGWAHYSKLL